MLCYHFFYNVRIYAIYREEFLNIYACAYKRNLEMVKCNIYYRKIQLNSGDIFFANGKNTFLLNVNEKYLLKKIPMNDEKMKKIKIIICTADGQKIKRKCRIRRVL